MRIGIDIRLQHESGVGRYIRNLTERLKIFDTTNEYVFINPSVRWHSIDEQLRMPKEYNRNNLDLIHIPYFNVPLFYNRSFVVTIHDVILDHFPTGRASTHPMPIYLLKRLAYKKTMQHAVKKSRAIIVPSIATKKALMSLYKVEDKKVHVVYEGVDQEVKSFHTGRPFKIGGSSVTGTDYILYVGNAYPHKNLDTLISAFEKVSSYSASNLKLILVGKEDYFYKRLKKQIQHSPVRKNIVFAGHVSDRVLFKLYNGALCLVCPSFMEGFGLPALEAMQSKCLVLASDIPVFREICNGSCLYFNPNDEKHLARLLSEVLEKRESQSRLTEKGQKRSTQFSWDKMVRETIDIYERCTRL